MNITIHMNANPDVLQLIGKEINKLWPEVTGHDAHEYMVQVLANHFEDLKTRKNPGKISQNEIKKRALELITKGIKAGPIPLRGATNRELINILGIETSRVRWATWDLYKEGKIERGGNRDTSKVWVLREPLMKNESRNNKNVAFGS